MKDKKSTYHQKKDSKLLMTCDCFRQYKKSLTRKNVLGKTHDELPRFVFKKWIEVHDQLCNAEDRYKPGKQIRFKTSMLRSDL